MKNTAITVCACIALLSFSVLCASGVWFVRSANAVIVGLPVQMDNRVAAIQKDLARQISAAITDANNRINGVLTVVDQRTDQALKIVDSRSADILDQTHGVVAVAQHVSILAESDLNDRLKDTNKVLADTAKPISESAQQFNAALPDFLDCQYDATGVGNKNCLYVRYGDLSSSLDRTLSAVAGESHAMADHMDKMAAASVVTSEAVAATSVEVKKAAQNFNKPQTKIQAFRSWLITLAKVYGAL